MTLGKKDDLYSIRYFLQVIATYYISILTELIFLMMTRNTQYVSMVLYVFLATQFISFMMG